MTKSKTTTTLPNYQMILSGATANLDTYMQSVSQIPVLTKEQEVELAVQLRDEGNLDAAQNLILPHLRFVVHIARGYNGYGLQLSDLIQEGNIGLMKAVKRFDPERGVRLVSFAVHWIRAEIHEHIIRNWRVVKIATTKAQRKLFFNLRKMRKNLSWLSYEESKHIAKELGVKVEVVQEMEKRLTGQDIGFDLQDSDEEKSFAPVAYLEHKNADPAQLIEANDFGQHNLVQLSSALGELDERSRDILQQRWLDDDKKATLHELAAKYSVSAERIRQIESNAIKKLRKFIL